MTGTQVDELWLENALEHEIKAALVRQWTRDDMSFEDGLYTQDTPLIVCEDMYLTHDREEANEHGWHREYSISNLSNLTPGIIIDECRDAFLWS